MSPSSKKLYVYYCHFDTLFEKSNFCPKIQFWQNHNIFTSFSPKFFWQFFSWNQSCQQLKSPKPQHFHEFFTQKIDNFLIKVEFLDKKLRFRTVCDKFSIQSLYNSWNYYFFRKISQIEGRLECKQNFVKLKRDLHCLEKM